MKYFLSHLILTIFLSLAVRAHDNSYLVTDSTLLNTLREYLLAHPTVYTKDNFGKRIEFSEEELEEIYKDYIIMSTNLRFDSSLKDKSIVGIYRFGVASTSELPWLYIQHKNSIEFIDLDPKKFNPEKTLKRFQKFCKRNPSITEQEKVRMLKEAFEVIYSNMYESFGCY